MGWNITDDVTRFQAHAGDFLRADAARNTVPLSIIETVRAHGGNAFADGPVHFGWWRPAGGGEVGGAFLITEPFPLVLTAMPDSAARELADALTERRWDLAGVTAEQRVALAFAEAWRRRAGVLSAVGMRQRLHRLDRLDPPRNPPDGAARFADPSDLDLLISWVEPFEREVGAPTGASPALVENRISSGGYLLWEADGTPVAMAARTRPLAGVGRVSVVYTPPEHRRRGYGEAVTAACGRSVLDDGARAVVLFSDLANPTSNALYHRLGYRPVEDLLMLSFRRAPAQER